MWKITRNKEKQEHEASPRAPPPVVVLVIQVDKYDWTSIFSGTKLNCGREIEVVQTGWQNILVHADSNSYDARPIVEVHSDEVGKRARTVRPDFLLIRNEVMTPLFDGRALLSGFMFSNVPSINSLESIYFHCDRAAMMGYLHKLNRELGDDVFPVIKQHFASGHRSLMYGNTFPAVIKIGTAHAGAGKMRIEDHHQMSDMRSVLVMMPHNYCLVEPFIDGAYDLRIQKIGSHMRAFRRIDISGEWKTNTGTSLMEEVPIEDRWIVWVNHVKAMFGGLDILTVDAIVEESSGNEFILEVNGTSSGLHPDYAEEDNNHIRDLVVERLDRMFAAAST